MITSLPQKLIVNGKIRLFKIDLTNYGGQIYYVHGHLNFFKEVEDVSSLTSVIVWQGQEYSPIPIMVSNLGQRTDGKVSSPVLSVGNIINGVVGGMTALSLRYKEFAGSTITIIDTFTKYLDAVNFANGNPTASNDAFIQEWRFQQLTNETDNQLDWDLGNPMDMDGDVLPARSIDQICNWARKGLYRGSECGYTGTQYFDIKDQPTTDPSKDECAGWNSSCQCRFGKNGILRHGGFPSSGFIS